MNNHFFCCFLFCSALVCEPLELVIEAGRHEAMALLCVIDQGMVPEMQHFVQYYLSSLLAATRQFSVKLRTMSDPRAKKEMNALAAEGFPLAIFVTGNNEEIDWRLYDTMNAQLVKGKKSYRQNLSDHEWAIIIADQIWPLLTSQEGSFSSLIAACKERGRNRDLYLIHPFYSAEQFAPIKLVGKGNNFAPRWHRTRSVIFYSQHTPANIRLLSVDPEGFSRVITSFEGQNMTPAISKDGRVVLALSSKQNTQLYEYSFDSQKHKSSFIRLTHEPGDFISPSFLSQNELIFCYLDSNATPKLGILNLDNQSIDWLKVGRALCPAVNPSGDKIAYCKRVNGIYQLFLYDRENREEQQLTQGKDHIDECSWSPCGNYIVCCIEKGDESRIALIDVDTRVVRYLTPLKEQWSYPSWSPRLKIPFVYRKKA